MTEIIVRTHRGEYDGGATVYGAVYLKVDAPSSAYGIRLKVFGYETYFYSGVQGWKATEEERVVQDTKEYIQCHDIKLYEFPGPIALGCYVFPFRKSLPRDLPRSFHASSVEGPTWQAQIVYQVEAELMGAESVKHCQTFEVNQALAEQYKVPCMKASGTVSVKGSLPLQKVAVTAAAALDRDTYYKGDTMRLNLEFSSKGLSKPRLDQIQVKLVRHLALVFRNPGSASYPDLMCSADAGSTSSDILSLPGLSMMTSLFGSDKKSRIPAARNIVYPENGPKTVWQCALAAHNNVNLFKGLQDLRIPLQDSDPEGGTLLPTTVGKHIICIYTLHVEHAFRDGGRLGLCIPVPHLQERAALWEAWDPPEWLANCVRVKVICQEYAVSESVLESEVYSKLPSFQII